MLEFDRTAGELAGHSADNHDRTVSFSRAERYNRVVVFRASSGAPSFDRSPPRERAALVVDHAVAREASSERSGVASFLRREVRGDGRRQID